MQFVWACTLYASRSASMQCQHPASTFGRTPYHLPFITSCIIAYGRVCCVVVDASLFQVRQNTAWPSLVSLHLEGRGRTKAAILINTRLILLYIITIAFWHPEAICRILRAVFPCGRENAPSQRTRCLREGLFNTTLLQTGARIYNKIK